MSKTTNPEKANNNESLFISRVAALLDFFSDRATAHASLFVASIFGILTMLSLVQNF